MKKHRKKPSSNLRSFNGLYKAPRSHLAKWLRHPGAEVYLGSHVSLKLKVLAHVVSGEGSLAAIARRFNVSRQACHFQAVAARAAFGIVKG